MSRVKKMFSNNFQIYKPNGTFLCDIQFDKPIQRPSDIHLTRDGKLYISNFLLHIVSVYQLGQQWEQEQTMDIMSFRLPGPGPEPFGRLRMGARC